MTLSQTSEEARPLGLAARIRRADQFLHLHALGFTLVWPLLGAATVRPSVGFLDLLFLGLVTTTFHVFAFVLNDLIDVEIDRLNPSRAGSALISGRISRVQALLIIVASIPAALLISLLHGAPFMSWLWLGLSFGAMAVYNLVGKKNRFPPLTDFRAPPKTSYLSHFLARVRRSVRICP